MLSSSSSQFTSLCFKTKISPSFSLCLRSFSCPNQPLTNKRHSSTADSPPPQSHPSHHPAKKIIKGTPAPPSFSYSSSSPSSWYARKTLSTQTAEDAVKKISEKQAFVIDMDGVIYHKNTLLRGAREFVSWLHENNRPYIFLTNSSERTPSDLSNKLQRFGLNVPSTNFRTSALSTAAFLSSQKPNGSAYVIGEPGLIHALYSVGYSMNEINPDYVVVGETSTYSYDKIAHAIDLVLQGASLVATNTDIVDRQGETLVPATGALVAPIELATGRKAYCLGKPNPLIMRFAAQAFANIEPEHIAVIGDRMDTDIIAGVESGYDTILLLSGVTRSEDLVRFAYKPTFIFDDISGLLTGDGFHPS